MNTVTEMCFIVQWNLWISTPLNSTKPVNSNMSFGTRFVFPYYNVPAHPCKKHCFFLGPKDRCYFQVSLYISTHKMLVMVLMVYCSPISLEVILFCLRIEPRSLASQRVSLTTITYSRITYSMHDALQLQTAQFALCDGLRRQAVSQRVLFFRQIQCLKYQPTHFRQ
jgi:hypothetical protein